MEQKPIPGLIETDHVADQDETAMRHFLGAFNHAQAGPEGVQPLSLMLRANPEAPTQGGLIGWSFYGWLYIALVYLPEHRRRAGFGTKLLRRAETIARQRGCRGIWLDTFSFQARGFYEKLGFTAFGEIEDYPPGHSRIFLKKRLDRPNPQGNRM